MGLKQKIEEGSYYTIGTKLKQMSLSVPVPFEWSDWQNMHNQMKEITLFKFTGKGAISRYEVHARNAKYYNTIHADIDRSTFDILVDGKVIATLKFCDPSHSDHGSNAKCGFTTSVTSAFNPGRNATNANETIQYPGADYGYYGFPFRENYRGEIIQNNSLFLIPKPLYFKKSFEIKAKLYGKSFRSQPNYDKGQFGQVIELITKEVI